MKKIFFTLTISLLISGCTQIVTAPIKVAGAAASATIDVAGAASGAVVNTVTGGSKDKD